MSSGTSLPPTFKVFPKDSRTTKKLPTVVRPVSVATRRDAAPHLAKSVNDMDIVVPDSVTRKSLDCLSSPDFLGYFVEVENDSTSKSQRGLLIPTPTDALWTIFYLRDVEEIHTGRMAGGASSGARLSDTFTPQDFFDSENIILNDKFVMSDTVRDSSVVRGFSMRPPTVISKQFEDSLKTVDPREFLGNRYFTMLYSQSMPLEFFTKSALPRVHILSHSDVQLTKDSIAKFMIRSTAVFDTRHSFARMLADDVLSTQHFKEKWLDSEVLLDPMECTYREEFLHRVCGKSATFSKEKITNALTKLKVTDAKLQILLALELLHIFNTTEEKESSSDKANEPEVRPRLVRSKGSALVGRKKRLMPTFVGTVIPVNTQFTTDLRLMPFQQQSEVLDSATVERLIRGLFDRLCVWDAILGVSDKSDKSAFIFLKTSVIPFYAKKHHKLLKELVRRSKGLSPSAAHRKHHHHHHQSTSKTPPKLHSRPALVRRSSSLAGLPGLTLRRGSSSFVSHEDLSKKTFEMVKTTSFSQLFKRESSSLPPPAPDLPSTQDSIFNHSRKRRLVAPEVPATKNDTVKEVTEIKATPLKKIRRSIHKSEVVEKSSPLNPINEVSIEASSPLVRATPAKSMKPLKQSEPVIIDSPVETLLKSRSTPLKSSPLKSSPVVLSTQHDNASSIFSTPMKAERQLTLVLDSSPLIEENIKDKSILRSKPTRRRLNFK